MDSNGNTIWESNIGADLILSSANPYAIDIDDDYGYMSNADMFEYIKNNLSFDQMIWEFGDDTNPNWVHVSYVDPGSNRHRCLKASRVNGKTAYQVI